MASIFEDVWEGITDYISGGKKSSRNYENKVKEAADAYKKIVEEAGKSRDEAYSVAKSDYDTAMKEASDAYGVSMQELQDYLKSENEAAEAMRKSDKELTAEGKEAASAAANNKAGIAKRNAKAAAMQTSGSKLMAAIQGAQGAVDASTQGYDESASEHANRAANLNQAAITNKMNQANQMAGLMSDTAKTKYSNATNTATNRYEAGLNAANKSYETATDAAKSNYDAANKAAELAASNDAESRSNKSNMVSGLLKSWLG